MYHNKARLKRTNMALAINQTQHFRQKILIRLLKVHRQICFWALVAQDGWCSSRSESRGYGAVNMWLNSQRLAHWA